MYIKKMTTLLCGCGGGYDIFCSLPLYFKFQNSKLLSFSFSLNSVIRKYNCVDLYKSISWIVYPQIINENNYFPEGYLSYYLNEEIYIITLDNENTMEDYLIRN